MKRRKILFVLVLGLALSIFFPMGFQSFAQDNYPNRAIEVIVPFNPGGPADLGIRFFSDKWAEFLGQPVVVVNKGGASGAVGARYVARSEPEGYTLLASNDSTLITACLESKDAGYDLHSFRNIWYHSKITAFFSVKSDARWKTLKEFMTEAKNNPGKLKYATWGPYSSSNMAMEMLCEAAGVKLTFVPFKTSPDSLAAVAGGNADLAVTFALSGLGKTGMIRPLAISDSERVLDYPDVPTLKELGYPIKFTSQDMGIALPAKTPEGIVSRLVEAHQKVRSKYAKEIVAKLPTIDQYPVYLNEKQSMEYLKEREKMYTDFYRKLGER
jgi:tripartite-type tricarboxylate transporter receptor subunit TctC